MQKNLELMQHYIYLCNVKHNYIKYEYSRICKESRRTPFDREAVDKGAEDNRRPQTIERVCLLFGHSRSRNKKNNQKMIQEVDYIELPAKEEPSRPTFEREKIGSSTFTTTAWFLSNFGNMAHHVWWGYKAGYYLVAFPCLFLAAFTVDFICIIARLCAYLVRRFFDLLLASMQTATKLIITAAAVIIVVMYIYNNGLDGMLSDYKKLCEWLECFVKPQ